MKSGKAYYKSEEGNYVGFFKNDKFEGSGVLNLSDKTTYKGLFKNG